MNRKISIVFTCAFCLSCVNFSMAKDIKQQQSENARGQAIYYVEAIDPDPDLTTFPNLEQDKVQYRDLPEEQETIAVIPSTLGSDADRVPTKIAPDGEPDVAVQPPQARRYILECD